MSTYNFILQHFGLQNSLIKTYPPGRPLDAGDIDRSNISKQEIADQEYSMTTKSTGDHALSMLGTPVFCDLILRSQHDAVSVTMLWALVEVNQTRNIVKTAVQGRDGTVKEYIADGDYQVQIRGGFVSPFSNAYPKAEVQNLITLCKFKESIKVVSEYLSMFDITDLVIEDYTMGQKEGVQNVQLFNLHCVSDTNIQLKQK